MEIIETLQRSRPEIVHVFDEIVRVLPEGVYLTYLKQTGARIEMRGVAQSSTRVSTFMRNIDARSGWPTRRCRSCRRSGNDATAWRRVHAVREPAQPGAGRGRGRAPREMVAAK